MTRLPISASWRTAVELAIVRGRPRRATRVGRCAAALDTVGSGSLADLVAIVGDAVHVASVADHDAASLGVAMAAGSVNTARSLAAAAAAGAAGTYTPRIEATSTPEQAADAQAHVQGGHTAGKVALTF